MFMFTEENGSHILLHILPAATLMWIVHTQDSQKGTHVGPARRRGLQEPPPSLFLCGFRSSPPTSEPLQDGDRSAEAGTEPVRQPHAPPAASLIRSSYLA